MLSLDAEAIMTLLLHLYCCDVNALYSIVLQLQTKGVGLWYHCVLEYSSDDCQEGTAGTHTHTELMTSND